MGRVTEWVRKYGIGGMSAVAVVALLVVGVVAVGGRGEERPSRAVLTLAADDDGTPDQGPGDVGSTTAPTTPTTAAPATTAVPSTAPATGTRVIPVAGVGVVVITESPLGLVSSTPAAGFTSKVESSTREVHVRFEDANGGRIDVQAEIEDGAVRVRVRDRRTGVSTAGSTSGTTTTPTLAVPATTVPSFDDHGGHGADDSGFDDHGGDDRSGHGGGDSGGDDHGGSSGHGGGDD
jgi:hypothetical protein